MTAEQAFFLQLLRDFVHQCPSVEPRVSLDWAKIARYTADQDLNGIIYYQCRDLKSIDPQIRESLHKSFLSDAYRSVNGEAAMAKLASRFDEAGIDYLPFKGQVLRQYYPVPELRTMGDRDILIHHVDRECSDRIMTELGYSKFIDNHAVWTYQRPALMFEIHDVMFYEYLANDVDYRSYFNRVWDSAISSGGHRFLPEPELHFLYLMTHTAKHIINNGMGFRAFLDMVFFCRSESSLDWNSLQEKLEELSLYEFTLRCFSLCEAWFDVKMPLSSEEPSVEFLLESTEKIFHDGIFGLENEDNAAAHSAKEIARDDKPYGLAAIHLVLRSLFPPYEDMQLIPWYAWLDGKPWLLPAAWVYRWFYVLLKKRDIGGAKLKEPFGKKLIEERQLLLKHWGL